MGNNILFVTIMTMVEYIYNDVLNFFDDGDYYDKSLVAIMNGVTASFINFTILLNWLAY